MKPLLSPDPTAGGDQPAKPASAAIVENAKTERELELERDLETERKAKRKLETDVAHLQDQNSQLREIGLKPAPRAESKAEPAKEESAWAWMFKS